MSELFLHYFISELVIFKFNFELNNYLIFLYVSYRGQESAGIVTSVGNDAKHFNVKKGMGLISGIFDDEAMKNLKGAHLNM